MPTASPPPLVPVSGTYTLVFKEFFAGYASFTRKTLLRSMLIQLIFMSAAVSYGQWITQGFFLRSPYGWAVVAFAVLAIVMIPIRFRRVYRKIFSGRFGGEETTATFDERGLSFQTPTVQTTLRWNGLTHFATKGDLLIAYRTTRVPYVIPKRAFASAAEFEMARQWCEQRIGYASESRGFEVVTSG